MQQILTDLSASPLLVDSGKFAGPDCIEPAVYEICESFLEHFDFNDLAVFSAPFDVKDFVESSNRLMYLAFSIAWLCIARTRTRTVPALMQ